MPLKIAPLIAEEIMFERSVKLFLMLTGERIKFVLALLFVSFNKFSA